MRRLVRIVNVLVLLFVAVFILSDSVPFDLQEAIDRCSPGDKVAVPQGTFGVDEPVRLRSGVEVVGAGVDKTTITMPAQDVVTNLFAGVGVSDVAVRDLTLSCSAATGQVLALHLSDYSSVTIERVKVAGCQYALKADTNGNGLVVRDFTARACGQIYVSNLTDGSFEGLDLEMVTDRLSTTTFHALYIAANNHDLEFKDVRAAGGSGWTVQLYHSGSLSAGISFDGLTVSGRWAVVVGEGFSHVSFKNVTATATTGDAPVFDVSDGPVTVDGFVASGGSALVGGATTEPVTFLNGTYAGPQLYLGGQLDNLALENVRLSSNSTAAGILSATPTVAR